MDTYDAMVVRRYSDAVEWERLSGERWLKRQPGPGALEFNLFSLAAAAARMQLTYLTPQIMQAPQEAHLETFRRQTRRMFEDLQMLIAVDDGDGMALVPPPAHWLMDFERTTLAGRVGAGFAMLVMCALGYRYVGPYEHVAVAPDKRSGTPDFVFASSGCEHALVEAKGSFSLRARIRETARKALRRQVAPALSVNPDRWGCAIATGMTTRDASRPGIVLCDLGSPPLPMPPTQQVDTSSRDVDPFLRWGLQDPQMFRAHWMATLAFCGFPASARAMWHGEPMSAQALAEDGIDGGYSSDADAVLGSTAIAFGSALGKLECGLEPAVAQRLRAILVDADVMHLLCAHRLAPKGRETGPEWTTGTEQSMPGFEPLDVSSLNDEVSRLRFPDGVVCILKRVARGENEPHRPDPFYESGYGLRQPGTWEEANVGQLVTAS